VTVNEPDYPWYALVDGAGLAQGDILRKCLAPLPPILRDPGATQTQEAAVEFGEQYDQVVVLSQSCDLVAKKIQRVMVCPIYPLDDFLDVAAPGGKKERERVQTELRKSQRTAHHLLNKCAIVDYGAPHMVAAFGEAFTIPFGYAISLAREGKRLRLLPPYREQLSQMFARFYMRVGLPLDIEFS
jgi:hypothetical protein